MGYPIRNYKTEQAHAHNWKSSEVKSYRLSQDELQKYKTSKKHKPKHMITRNLTHCEMMRSGGMRKTLKGIEKGMSETQIAEYYKMQLPVVRSFITRLRRQGIV